MNNLTRIYRENVLARALVDNMVIYAHLMPDGVEGGELNAWLLSDAGNHGAANDSRERLEADVRARSIRPGTQIDCTYGDVMRWLDRQDAIALAEYEEYDCIKAAQGERIAELEAERDELCDELAKRDQGIARLKRQRDKWRTRCDELLNAADGMRVIADAWDGAKGTARADAEGGAGQ